MCGMCGLLQGSGHWSQAPAGSAGRRQRLIQIARANRLLALWRLRRPLLVALAVGAAAGVAAFAAGPWVAGLLTGLAGSAATLAIQARQWLEQAFGGFAVATDS